MKAKNPNDVRGSRIKCKDYDACALCYGCRAFNPAYAKCHTCKQENQKQNICNTTKHRSDLIEKMILRPVIVIE